jgi:hypothetical protein
MQTPLLSLKDGGSVPNAVKAPLLGACARMWINSLCFNPYFIPSHSLPPSSDVHTRTHQPS